MVRLVLVFVLALPGLAFADSRADGLTDRDRAAEIDGQKANLERILQEISEVQEPAAARVREASEAASRVDRIDQTGRR